MNLGDDLYREIILENYKSTKNKGPLESPAFHQEGVNPSCGDDIELYLKSDGEQITDAAYEGIGCSICLASANMLCEAIKGMSVDEAEALIDKVKGMLTRNETPDLPEGAEDLEAIQGVSNYPVRIKCALLSWNTLNQILDEIKSGGQAGSR
ncbi:MAG: Fe-S cluster assembly sulfur transfer protein SufU [Spirochaetota bacterium]